MRFLLGLGEAGNFPASIKTVAEWFPKKERALATGIFNSGTNVGAIVTPLMLPAIVPIFGMGASSPGSAPRASPAISIAHAPRTTAAATPMQNVTSSVARKSTTIGRTLNLPLEASIFDPLSRPRSGLAWY